MEQKVGIGISCTQDHLFAVGTLVINLLQLHNPEKFCFHIFTDGTNSKFVEAMVKLEVSFEVHDYRPPFAERLLWGTRSIAQFSPMVLAKFEILKLLQNHKLAAWMDYDLVVQRAIPFELIGSSAAIAFVPSGHTVADALGLNPEDLSPELSAEGMSAGFIVASGSMLKSSTFGDRLKSAFLNFRHTLKFPEQGCFDIAIHETGLSVLHLERSEFAAFPGTKDESEACILHSWGGRDKFWITAHNERWNENYRQWLSIGGNKYSKHLVRWSRIKRKIRYALVKTLTL